MKKLLLIYLMITRIFSICTSGQDNCYKCSHQYSSQCDLCETNFYSDYGVCRPITPVQYCRYYSFNSNQCNSCIDGKQLLNEICVDCIISNSIGQIKSNGYNLCFTTACASQEIANCLYYSYCQSYDHIQGTLCLSCKYDYKGVGYPRITDCIKCVDVENCLFTFAQHQQIYSCTTTTVSQCQVCKLGYWPDIQNNACTKCKAIANCKTVKCYTFTYEICLECSAGKTVIGCTQYACTSSSSQCVFCDVGYILSNGNCTQQVKGFCIQKYTSGINGTWNTLAYRGVCISGISCKPSYDSYYANYYCQTCGTFQSIANCDLYTDCGYSGAYHSFSQCGKCNIGYYISNDKYSCIQCPSKQYDQYNKEQQGWEFICDGINYQSKCQSGFVLVHGQTTDNKPYVYCQVYPNSNSSLTTNNSYSNTNSTTNTTNSNSNSTTNSSNSNTNSTTSTTSSNGNSTSSNSSNNNSQSITNNSSKSELKANSSILFLSLSLVLAYLSFLI